MVKENSKKKQILYGKKLIPTETSEGEMTSRYKEIRGRTNESCKQSRKNYKEVIPNQLDEILKKFEEERKTLEERLGLLKNINDPEHDINSLRQRQDFSEIAMLLKNGIEPLNNSETFQYSEEDCLEKLNKLYKNKKFRGKKGVIAKILEINEHNIGLSKEIEVEIEATKLRFNGIIFE
jgi:hypothetical protein